MASTSSADGVSAARPGRRGPSATSRGRRGLYAALLKEFPSDERAGVAALELGRLRMDAQRSYRPAAKAFRTAIAAAPNEGFREDALARLIAVLDPMHESDGSRRERAGYLQRYPRGLYVRRSGTRAVSGDRADATLFV